MLITVTKDGKTCRSFVFDEQTTYEDLVDLGVSDSVVINALLSPVSRSEWEVGMKSVIKDYGYMDSQLFELIELFSDFDDDQREILSNLLDTYDASSLVSDIANVRYALYDSYADLARDYVDIDDEYENYFDYEEYGRDYYYNSDGVCELSDGTIVKYYG